MDAQDSRLTEGATALTCLATRTSAEETKESDPCYRRPLPLPPGGQPPMSRRTDEFPLMTGLSNESEEVMVSYNDWRWQQIGGRSSE